MTELTISNEKKSRSLRGRFYGHKSDIWGMKGRLLPLPHPQRQSCPPTQKPRSQHVKGRASKDETQNLYVHYNSNSNGMRWLLLERPRMVKRKPWQNSGKKAMSKWQTDWQYIWRMLSTSPTEISRGSYIEQYRNVYNKDGDYTHFRKICRVTSKHFVL